MNIVLGITGGIAAYKAPDLVRRLKERGADVQIVMTASAAEFVTDTALQAVSGRPVRSNLWDKEAERAMSHIELARWADVILIAPATAEVMARIVSGGAPDLLTTICLATEAPLAIAPAMNHVMWNNPATQANRKTLEERGVHILGPDIGSQACGEAGGEAVADVIDLGFVTVVLAADVGLLALLQLTPRDVRVNEAADIYRSKVTISILLILLMAASLFLPYQNRVFLVALPVFLMFEHHIAAMLGHFRKRKPAT